MNDSGELVFAWNDFGKCALRFTPLAAPRDNELFIEGEFHLGVGLSFQGETTLTLLTMCYAQTLLYFASELRAFHQGEKGEVIFDDGSGDLQLLLPAKPIKQEGQHRFRPSIPGWELRYLVPQHLGDYDFWAECRILLGAAGDVAAAAAAIEQFLVDAHLNTKHCES